MLQADGVTAGSVLLVDSVNNRTNGSLNANEGNGNVTRNALANNGKFTLVSVQQLSMAKQLGWGCLTRIVWERAVKLLALRAMSGAICTLLQRIR